MRQERRKEGRGGNRRIKGEGMITKGEERRGRKREREMRIQGKKKGEGEK